MSLTLSLRNLDGLSSIPESRKTLESGTLRVGRETDSDWVLPDPAGVISRKHCVIEGSDTTYELRDYSTNGVFVNDSATRVDQGSVVLLHNGDILRIGDYEVEVQLSSSEQNSSLTDFQPRDGRSDAEEYLPVVGPDDERLREIWWRNEDEENGEAPIPPEERGSAAAFSDFIGMEHTEPTSDAMPRIPEGWWKKGEDEQPEPTPVATPQAKTANDSVPEAIHEKKLEPRAVAPSSADSAAEQRSAQIEPPTQSHPDVPPADRLEREMLAAFLAGAGLENLDVRDARAVEMMEMAGKSFRQLVEGLIRILEARREFKDQARAKITHMTPEETNPLKFSINAEEAMTRLLGPTPRGYLPPGEAIAEAFRDMEAHEIAIVASMQQAWIASLRRFDPETFERRIDEGPALSKWVTSRKARCWDAFVKFYQEIGTPEEYYHDSFDDEFVRIYDEEINKITFT